MLGSAKVMAFVSTADAAEARRFYCDVLGLRLIEDSPFALVVDAGGTMLRIQKVETVVTPPYTSLGWEAGDIEATVRALTQDGVEFMRVDGIQQDELGIWTTPAGWKVAWFKDPDGNTLSLAQVV
jgi:catechol 2,3-dioxygenase-like lactoylglutathione lyase family enzyme